MHELSDHARKATEAGAWGFALLSGGLTLANAAVIVSILAGLASLILACLRIYDRIMFGPRG